MTLRDRLERHQPVIVAVVLAAVVLGMGFWPWRPMVDVFPHGSDATRWVQESHPSQPGWARYVFLTRHFIGYRPVAALTYTLSGLVSGWEPWAYRLTDVALHALVGVLLLYVYRALTGDRSVWGLLAPIVFFLHPATEDVVPHLARRSYSLSCSLALASLLALARAARLPRRPLSGWTWLATLLILLAMASNEVAGVVLVMFPLLALHLRPPDPSPWWRSLLVAAPAFVGTGLLLLVRLQVIGYAGGYHKRYFAYTDGEQNLLREIGDTPYQEIMEAAWRYAAFPSSASGEHALLLGSTTGLVVALGVGLFYAWQGVARPAAGWRRAHLRLPALLVIWLFGYTLLYALTRNWFWRQAYPMLLPLSLLVTVVARRTWEDAEHPARRLLLLVPQLALLASLAWHSPAVWGLDTSVLRGPMKMSQVILDVRRVVESSVEEPAMVYLAVPTRSGNGHMVRIWSRQLLSHRHIGFKLLAVGEPTAPIGLDTRLLSLRPYDGRLRMELAPGMTWSEVAASAQDLRTDREWLDTLHTRGLNTYLYWRDGHRGLVVEVPAPPATASSPDPSARDYSSR